MSNTHKDLMVCTVIGIILVFTGIYLNDSIVALFGGLFLGSVFERSIQLIDRSFRYKPFNRRG